MSCLSARWFLYRILIEGAGLYADKEDLNHIQDLIEAEEQGLLLKLPCKVGDKIYVIEDGYMYDFKIDNIDVRKENGEYIFCLAFMDFKANDFGKIVFLSEEEAKAKLKEMDGES